MNRISVDVIIPNYNRTALLHRALVSISMQTRRPQGVIIVDDCSDACQLAQITAIVESFRSVLAIRLLVNNENRGANHARNQGIAAATADYIAFLDSDDFWMSDKLDIQMGRIEDCLGKGARPVLSATGRYRVNNQGEIIARQFSGITFNPARIRRSNFIGTLSSVVVDRVIARRIGGFNEALPASQDWDFFIRLADDVDYVGVPTPLCVYAEHDGDRITASSRRRLKSHFAMHRMHFQNSGLPAHLAREFHRNLSEDFQIAGKPRRAREAYATYRHMMLPALLRQAVPKAIILFYFRLLGLPDIKSARYARYERALLAFMERPDQARKLRADQDLIRAMILLKTP